MGSAGLEDPGFREPGGLGRPGGFGVVHLDLSGAFWDSLETLWEPFEKLWDPIEAPLNPGTSAPPPSAVKPLHRKMFVRWMSRTINHYSPRIVGAEGRGRVEAGRGASRSVETV